MEDVQPITQQRKIEAVARAIPRAPAGPERVALNATVS
jgi:hypothetical protein